VAADAERSEAFAAALGEWVEAGAITRSELDELPARAERNPRSRDAARHRMLQQWAWSAPVLDGGRSLLEAFAESDAGTQDQRRRAHDLTHARWGLWEVASQVSAPGVFVEELLTGERPYLDLPEDALSELPRWSTLIGCVVPVDGTWRAGDWFQVASPVEARLLVHEVFDQIIDHEKELGREGRPAVQMARQAHHEMGPFWLPQAMPLPSPEAAGLVLAVVRSMAPVMVASVRRMRGELLDEEEGARYFTVSVADQDAAWEALTRQPGFARDEADDDELAWLREPAGGAEPAEPRAWITFDEDGLGVEVEDRGDLDELLRLMETLGHPPRAVEEPIDEAPEPPVELPDLEGAELGEWLSEWPDVPLGGFEEAPTPRQLMEEDEGLVLEMLVRYMEHDADRRGVKDLDTDALRGELDLEVVEEGPARTGGDRALPTQTK
jgi:hypothetical protein